MVCRGRLVSCSSCLHAVVEERKQQSESVEEDKERGQTNGYRGGNKAQMIWKALSLIGLRIGRPRTEAQCPVCLKNSNVLDF